MFLPASCDRRSVSATQSSLGSCSVKVSDAGFRNWDFLLSNCRLQVRLARLDDLLNIIPARISAFLLLLVASTCSWASVSRGFRVMLRDRTATSSPNAGWPMAAIAGVLGTELSKPEHYVLGRGLAPCNATLLRRACLLSELTMHASAVLLIFLLAGAIWW